MVARREDDRAHKAEEPLLDVSTIEVVYGGTILAVSDVTLTVGRGEIVALLGANGAGKSTTLKAISGVAAADRAAVSRGHVRFNGAEILALPANRRVALGIAHILEGRHVFKQLTVEENLMTGAFLRRPGRRELQRQVDEIYDWFPRLKDRRHSRAGLTSGGEQQMLAIGRGLLTQPRLVLLDEPTMGLAPTLVEEIFAFILRLNREKGTAFLLSEQNTSLALSHADRAYILDNGKVALAGSAKAIAARDDLHRIYLGAVP
jgi:branched-chain amino acid transport system ATP-binding protein